LPTQEEIKEYTQKIRDLTKKCGNVPGSELYVAIREFYDEKYGGVNGVETNFFCQGKFDLTELSEYRKKWQVGRDTRGLKCFNNKNCQWEDGPSFIGRVSEEPTSYATLVKACIKHKRNINHEGRRIVKSVRVFNLTAWEEETAGPGTNIWERFTTDKEGEADMLWNDGRARKERWVRIDIIRTETPRYRNDGSRYMKVTTSDKYTIYCIDTATNTVENKTWMQGTEPDDIDWEECGNYEHFLTDKKQSPADTKWYKLCPEAEPVEMKVTSFKRYIDEVERLAEYSSRKKKGTTTTVPLGIIIDQEHPREKHLLQKPKHLFKGKEPNHRHHQNHRNNKTRNHKQTKSQTIGFKKMWKEWDLRNACC